MRCPYCGSKLLYPDNKHKTFSTGKAIAGGLAFGVVGAAAGFIGKDTKGYRCSACGSFSENSMDLNTEYSINRAINDAKHGNDFSVYEQLKQQYPNIETIYPPQQNNSHPQLTSNENHFVEFDFENNYTVDNNTDIKNTYHPNIFIPNCPIYVEEIIIKTSDSGDKLSLKAWNNSNKTLRSAYFNVKVFDDVGDEISNYSCVYQGMMVESGMQLPAEKEFNLNTDIAYTIQYDIEKAAFDDGSVWRKDDQNESFKLSEQSELSPHSFPKYKHLKSLFLEKSNSEYDGSLFEPIFEETHTQCICGFPRKREGVCVRCGLNDEAISEVISYDNILKRQRDTIIATAKKRAKETQKLYDSGCKEIYKKAINLQSKETKKDVQESIKLFNKILDYKDSAEQIEKCNQNIKAINEKLEAKRIADAKAAEEKRAKEEAERKEKERLAEIERAEAEKRSKRNKKIAIITTPIVCAIIAFIIVLNTVIIPNNKYNNALAFMEAGEYNKAITIFESLKDYKDSAAKINECKYNDAIVLWDSKNLDGAYSIFQQLGDYKDSAEKASTIKLQKSKEQLKTAKVGSYITFGTYEQDNNTSNGNEDIEWIVLNIKDGKALVISKYALDKKPYNNGGSSCTWETCTLRKWLNNDFINTAFTKDETAMIPTVTVPADKSPYHSTDPGNATQDRVFLLSITEATKYLKSSNSMRCKPTNYLANLSVSTVDNFCWWWLRTPGLDKFQASVMHPYGHVYEYRYTTGNSLTAVRPAMWIDLNQA